jgi:hypothetical protein
MQFDGEGGLGKNWKRKRLGKFRRTIGNSFPYDKPCYSEAHFYVIVKDEWKDEGVSWNVQLSVHMSIFFFHISIFLREST